MVKIMEMKDQKQIPETTVNAFVSQLTEIYSAVINSHTSVHSIPTPFLWGPPGVGKSDAVRELADRLKERTGKEVVVTDIRLLLFSPVDLRGIPVPDADRKFSNWLMPKIFALDPSDRVVNILFLDELSAAPPSLQASAYQITLNHAIGEHKLPDNCIVIAAGNRTSDRSVAFRMPHALANRMMHFEITVDFPSWREWALQNHIHRLVVNYLTHDPAKLMRTDPGMEETVFSTPRSWAFVSSLLYAVRPDADLSDYYVPIAGCIGTVSAMEFIRWCKVYTTMPDIVRIFQGYEVRNPSTSDEMYDLIKTMLDYVKEKENGKGISAEELENAVRYAQRFPPDYLTMLYVELYKMETVKSKLMMMPEYFEWMKHRGTSELKELFSDL